MVVLKEMIQNIKETLNTDFVFDAETSAIILGHSNELLECVEVVVADGESFSFFTLGIEVKVNVVQDAILTNRDYLMGDVDIVIRLINKHGLLVNGEWETVRNILNTLEEEEVLSTIQAITPELYQLNKDSLFYFEGE